MLKPGRHYQVKTVVVGSAYQELLHLQSLFLLTGFTGMSALAVQENMLSNKKDMNVQEQNDNTMYLRTYCMIGQERWPK